jgi:hypothetical protein
MTNFYSSKLVRALFFIALSQSARAQTATLNLSSGTATRGGGISLNLDLTTTSGLMPSAMQWTLGYSATDISSISVNAGPAATAAGKSLLCNPSAGFIVCIIYGTNSNPMANGTVGVVNLGISPTTSNTSTVIAVFNPMESDPTGTASVPLTPSNGTIAITTGVPLPISPVSLSPAGGSFTGSVDVTLSTATAGATIYYTLDGSTPGTGSPVYTAPIHLTQTGWIRAMGVQSGSIPSPVSEGLFTILSGPAAPVIAPNGGTFTTCPDVTLSTNTLGGLMFYTLDGSVPSLTSNLYLLPIHLTQSTVVNARTFLATVGSSTSQATFTVNCATSGPLAPPTISPNGGIFTGSVDVTLTAASGATLYYTLDGSTPGTNSSQYSAPIHLAQSGWVRTIAVKAGSPSSSVAETSFIIVAPAPQQPPAPTIAPNGGTFSTCPDVALSSIAGATIYYTLDGSIPSQSSTLYSLPIHLTQSAIVTALAYSNGLSSSAAQAIFTVNCGGGGTVSPVAFAPGGNIFNGVVDVTLSTATAGATIYYTLDGTTPDSNAIRYVAPIHLTQTGWVRALAMQAGYISTPVTENYYVITTAPPPATPVIWPNGGTFSTCPDVTLSTVTTGATIYYTLDGSVPSVASTVYSQPIHLTQTTLVSARAFSGAAGSGTSQAGFTVNCTSSGPLAPPVISPGGGTFSSSVNVTLTAASGATIYYTFDGSTPGANALQYGAPIQLTQSAWIRAVAVRSGSPSSSVSEAYFAVQPGGASPATPSISPNGGTFSTCPDVTLSTTTPGAAIYFTLDGSGPTMSSAAYTGPIHLTASAWVRAAAFLSASAASSVVEASFTVNCQPSK